MSIAPAQPAVNPSGRKVLPPLESGDRLTRAEFERRYAAVPEIKKAELVEGVVYLARSVRYEGHGKPHAILGGWLGYYIAKTPNLTWNIHIRARGVHPAPQAPHLSHRTVTTPPAATVAH